MKNLKIGNRIIQEGGKPFVIAEAGVNYENSMETALEMVRQAAANGADAIKFQSYKAETLAAKDSPAYWDTDKTQRDFFKLYDSFSEDDYKELAREAKRNKIFFLSTPFDNSAVDFLDPLVPLYKIASADITNIPFLRYIAEKKKPIFLSTGAATLGEIENAITTIKAVENVPIVPLHCILSYPTKFEDANLRMIKHLKKIFPENLVGYSDHTKPDKAMITLIVAHLMGASVLEKHFTLDKTLPGNDHYHAMDPQDLKLLSENVELVTKILGEEEKRIIDAELPARKNARRSIVTTKALKAGDVITTDNITTKRPGKGINPTYYDLIIGKKILQDLEEDEILYWKYLMQE
ncbi:MAG: acetylneuraminic acid synthetase [Candidatus Heimdallarchaeota archaeon]|nr:acetylneuraminic acid synthetase [Candidatus Heimdallarchaeota archaeon]